MNKWIPVTEKLPPEEEEVLTYSTSTPWSFCYDDPHVLVGFHSVEYGNWYFPTDSHNACIEPTHWMPLPDPPKPELEGKDVL